MFLISKIEKKSIKRWSGNVFGNAMFDIIDMYQQNCRLNV